MKKKKSNTRKWIEDIVFVVIAVLLIRAYVVQAYRIPSGSMEQTLLIGDHLFACKFWYGIRIPFTDKRVLEFWKPRQKDVIVFRFPYERKDFVKRCVALGGDVVEIRNKQLYVNNKLLYEPYVCHKDSFLYERLEIPAFEYQQAWERGEFRNAGAMIRDNFGPVRVPPGCVFMIGDNRDYSFDSRFWGPLKKKWLLGKALILYFSWDNEPPLYKIWKKARWRRIGDIIQ